MTRRATLIVNPAAGRASLFAGQSRVLEDLLRSNGYEIEIRYTTALPESARELASNAKDADLVLACGGDGTGHGGVQGLAGGAAALGVLPLGTANALARNLHLPLDPATALRRLLTYAPRRIPLGQLVTGQTTRYFIVMAGCGPDGMLVNSLGQAQKTRFGRQAYYAHAARLFVTRRWPAFAVTYRSADGVEKKMTAVAVMAARVPNLGGAFSGLTRNASLISARLTVQVLRPPAQVSLPAWFGLSRIRLPNPWLNTIEVDEIRCTPLTAAPVYGQADAEPLGPIPMTLKMVPDALTLLMPPAEASR